LWRFKILDFFFFFFSPEKKWHKQKYNKSAFEILWRFKILDFFYESP